MGSFKRAFLGYRRDEVDAAVKARDARVSALERDEENALGLWREASETVTALEREATSLAEMVIEREREIRALTDRLRDANERHDRSIVSLESVSARLEEIHAQARGQATRIRMKALHDAVEVSRRAQELVDVEADGSQATSNGDATDLFEGPVKLEIGPLGDFSQLVGFEDAIGQLGASEISVERFSEGRATLSMRLNEPVELLRELEARSPLEFQVRRTADDNLILDVDEDQGPEQRAA
ncbi:MAG TPA: hypothetical protein VF259_05540 [Solirubrobacterales bacterium]